MLKPTKDQNQCNPNGHAEAVCARWLWGKEYADQRGGQMDFYNRLPDAKKKLVQRMVDEIIGAPGRAFRID